MHNFPKYTTARERSKHYQSAAFDKRFFQVHLTSLGRYALKDLKPATEHSDWDKQSLVLEYWLLDNVSALFIYWFQTNSTFRKLALKLLGVGTLYWTNRNKTLINGVINSYKCFYFL